MWVQILCGLIAYMLLYLFFDGDYHLQLESSNNTALFNVANRLEKLYGGKVYVGLRIPNADSCSRQDVDMVLVTKGEAVVISVKNFSGLVSINGDGTWVVVRDANDKHKADFYPDPVEEAKKQASVLESYLEQRGVALPEGYLSYKVVLPNPKFWTIHSRHFPPEVITYDQWAQLKPGSKSMFSGWIKGAFHGGKKEMQESIHEKLNFTLSTAPMWDRLELKGNKYVLIYRRTSMFGLADLKLQVLYSPRNYRSEGTSNSEWKEVTVKSSTEVLFQRQNSTRVGKFKHSSVISMSLGA